jgi:hypothetical protein
MFKTKTMYFQNDQEVIESKISPAYFKLSIFLEKK